jgi:hypothetical protein
MSSTGEQKTNKQQHQLHLTQGQPETSGAPSRPLTWCPKQANNLAPLQTNNLQALQHGWQTYLKAHAKMADNFQTNYFTCGKPKFTSITFSIIPVPS